MQPKQARVNLPDGRTGIVLYPASKVCVKTSFCEDDGTVELVYENDEVQTAKLMKNTAELYVVSDALLKFEMESKPKKKQRRSQ